MSKLLSVINALLGLTIVTVISYYVYGFSTAEGRVKETCNQIQPGMSFAELNAFSAERGLAPRPRIESGINFLVESRTFGRYGCKVLLERGVVKETEFNFAD